MIKEPNSRVLTLCAGAPTGLSAIVGNVAEFYRDADRGALRGKAMSVVQNLMKEGLIRAGRPTPDGKAFVAWDLAADESVARIQREWDALGRDPQSGDIAWFAATKEGVRVARG